MHCHMTRAAPVKRALVYVSACVCLLDILDKTWCTQERQELIRSISCTAHRATVRRVRAIPHEADVQGVNVRQSVRARALYQAYPRPRSQRSPVALCRLYCTWFGTPTEGQKPVVDVSSGDAQVAIIVPRNKPHVPNITQQRAGTHPVFQSVPVRKRRKVAEQANEDFLVRGGDRNWGAQVVGPHRRNPSVSPNHFRWGFTMVQSISHAHTIVASMSPRSITSCMTFA